jgi:hypothetical protein
MLPGHETDPSVTMRDEGASSCLVSWSRKPGSRKCRIHEVDGPWESISKGLGQEVYRGDQWRREAGSLYCGRWEVTSSGGENVKIVQTSSAEVQILAVQIDRRRT